MNNSKTNAKCTYMYLCNCPGMYYGEMLIKAIWSIISQLNNFEMIFGSKIYSKINFHEHFRT